MENLNLEYADSSSYKLWIKLGVAALAAGLIIAGLGHWFAPKHMQIVGNFLQAPGGVLVTAGIAVAGLSGDDLSDGTRMTALIVAGLLALMTF